MEHSESFKLMCGIFNEKIKEYGRLAHSLKIDLFGMEKLKVLDILKDILSLKSIEKKYEAMLLKQNYIENLIMCEMYEEALKELGARKPKGHVTELYKAQIAKTVNELVTVPNGQRATIHLLKIQPVSKDKDQALEKFRKSLSKNYKGWIIKDCTLLREKFGKVKPPEAYRIIGEVLSRDKDTIQAWHEGIINPISATENQLFWKSMIINSLKKET